MKSNAGYSFGMNDNHRNQTIVRGGHSWRGAKLALFWRWYRQHPGALLAQKQKAVSAILGRAV